MDKFRLCWPAHPPARHASPLAPAGESVGMALWYAAEDLIQGLMNARITSGNSTAKTAKTQWHAEARAEADSSPLPRAAALCDAAEGGAACRLRELRSVIPGVTFRSSGGSLRGAPLREAPPRGAEAPRSAQVPRSARRFASRATKACDVCKNVEFGEFCSKQVDLEVFEK